MPQRGILQLAKNVKHKTKPQRGDMLIMANTYSQIYIHIVFSVRRKIKIIPKEHREELHKFITGIIRNRNQKVLAIFAMPDHIHIFVSLKPEISISDLARDIKASSSKFINRKNWIRGTFNWQNGFGAFSHSKSNVETVIRYILNQEKHHKTANFKEEYIKFLIEKGIKYDDRYLFDLDD